MKDMQIIWRDHSDIKIYSSHDFMFVSTRTTQRYYPVSARLIFLPPIFVIISAMFEEYARNCSQSSVSTFNISSEKSALNIRRWLEQGNSTSSSTGPYRRCSSRENFLPGHSAQKNKNTGSQKFSQWRKYDGWVFVFYSVDNIPLWNWNFGPRNLYQCLGR